VRSRWKRIRYKIEWLALSAAARFVPLLSRKACFYLAQFLGALTSILDRQGRRVALSNLETAFGDQLSILQRKRIVRESYQHFARTMLDFLWSPRLTAENFSRYIEVQNFDETERAGGPERNVIIACYHYSNFEWLGLVGGFLGFFTTVITQEFKNSSLDAIFKKIREQTGHVMIPRERGIIRLYKALRRKGRTALLVDLTVPPRQGAVAIECFGLKTSVTSAHAWLHEQTGTAIVPAHCEPLPGGRYRVIVHPKIENTAGMNHQQIAQACWNSFEPYVRRNPAPWLWMYKHWRYFPASPDRVYPFYAQFSPEFDALVREAIKTPEDLSV
jgi:lauroyl/myristoyl acyltransferase